MIPQRPSPAGLHYPPEQHGDLPVLVLPSHYQMLEPVSDIPDRTAIPGNLPKSNLESNSQWGNRSVPPQRIVSQIQTGQLQSAAASPGVLRGDTGEISCMYIVCTTVFKQTNAGNLVFSCTPGQYTRKGHAPVIYLDVDVGSCINKHA